MTWTIWMAAVVVILTIAALLKRWETRLVLFTAGLVMAILSGAEAGVILARPPVPRWGYRLARRIGTGPEATA